MYSHPSNGGAKPIDVQELAKELAKHINLTQNVIYSNSPNQIGESKEPKFDTNENIAKVMLSDERLAGIVSNIDSRETNDNIHVASKRGDILDIIKTIRGNT